MTNFLALFLALLKIAAKSPAISNLQQSPAISKSLAIYHNSFKQKTCCSTCCPRYSMPKKAWKSLAAWSLIIDQLNEVKVCEVMIKLLGSCVRFLNWRPVLLLRKAFDFLMIQFIQLKTNANLILQSFSPSDALLDKDERLMRRPVSKNKWRNCCA